MVADNSINDRRVLTLAAAAVTATSMTMTIPPGFDMDGFEPCSWDFHFLPPGYEPEPEFVMPPIERSIHARMMASTSPVVFTAAVLPDMDPDASYGTIDTGPAPSVFESWNQWDGYTCQRTALP